MLSIIISTYNRPQLLQRCLAGALQAADSLDAEVIVVNDSKTASVNAPQHSKLKVLNNPKQGVASARNLGASMAAGDLLLFVDDDIEFDAKNVSGLLDTYSKRPPACYNTNWSYPDDMRREIEKTQFGRFLIKYKLVDYKGWVPDIGWQSTVFEARQLAAFFMLVPKTFFVLAGGFNEEFTNQGTEDDEFCKRLRKSGVKMYVDPANNVYHNEMDRMTLKSRMVRYYNGARNRRRLADMGDENYTIAYPTLKKFTLSVLQVAEPIWFLLARSIPNRRIFDPLYFSLAHLLIAIAIYKGYNKKA